MAYLNADYWKKAYLLEFRLNNRVQAAFTFSVPPESEEFVFPQRKNETKTFGGAVVADYGNDLVQINLSGSTINQELKIIYKSSFGIDLLTGEQEIFYLRDLLKEYGSQANLKGKTVYLYSLNGERSATNNPKWWQIYVGQLDISRNKDKPFCYNYKFSAIAAPEVKRIGSKLKILKKLSSTIESWTNAITDNIKKMDAVLENIINYGGDLLSDLKSLITTAETCLTAYESAMNKYINVAKGLINELGEVAIDTIGLGDKVLAHGIRYYVNAPIDVWNTCLDMKNAFKNVYDYCASLDETSYTTSAWQNMKELYSDGVTNEDISDTFSTIAHEGTAISNSCLAITSKALNDFGFAIKPGSSGEDDEIISTYGYKTVAITDAQTNWDQLAKDYYGDASLSYIIATYNNLSIGTELTAGQSVLIPQLNFAESKIAENEVYNSPDVKDNYGKDIAIIDNDFSAYNGDIALIGGIDNLEQALLNRYSTLINARIRLEAYGIQASIGDALNATSALIQASVHQTTIEDPRVESVEKITFKGSGDDLVVQVTYIDKNGTRQNLGGVI